MAKETKKENKKFIKTNKKLDDSVEIEIQKNPSKTLGGKIFIALLVIWHGAISKSLLFALLLPIAYKHEINLLSVIILTLSVPFLVLLVLLSTIPAISHPFISVSE